MCLNHQIYLCTSVTLMKKDPPEPLEGSRWIGAIDTFFIEISCLPFAATPLQVSNTWVEMVIVRLLVI